MIGFRTDLSRTIAPQLIFQREAARTVPEMRTAHYFSLSIRNLPVRSAKIISRHLVGVAVRALRQTCQRRLLRSTPL